MSTINKKSRKAVFMSLQDPIVQQLEHVDGGAKFIEDEWHREPGERLAAVAVLV